jgi:hypothetical protein
LYLKVFVLDTTGILNNREAIHSDMRPNRHPEEQWSPTFAEDMKRLYERAQKVVDEAEEAKKKEPGKEDELYERYLAVLRNEVFCAGCLGPGTGAADADTYLQKLGRIYGKFDQVEMDLDGMSFEEFVTMATRAAKVLDKNKYSISKKIEEHPKWKGFDIKVRDDPAKVAKGLEEFGLTWDNVFHFEMIEQYYDVYRCKMLIDPMNKKLIIKGRMDFVDQVLERN